MDFLPTAEQLDLQRGVRTLLEARFPLERLPDGYSAELWQALTETGVFSLRRELGLGLADAVLVFEELGRACVPGPLVGTFLAAGVGDGPVTVVDPAIRPLLVTHLDIATGLLVLDRTGPLVTGPVAGIEIASPSTHSRRCTSSPTRRTGPGTRLRRNPLGSGRRERCSRPRSRSGWPAG